MEVNKNKTTQNIQKEVFIIPLFSPVEVQKLVKNEYGFTPVIKELHSYIDQNFYVKNGDESGQEFVLKISYSDEKLENLELQHRGMELISTKSKEIKCPMVFKTKSGKDIFTMRGKDNTTHFVRMVTYIPGKFFYDLKDQSNELLQDLGYFMGTLDKTLLNFHHPSAYRYFNWDLKNTIDNKIYIENIVEMEKRNIVNHFLLQFETFVQPLLPSLRSSVIHNDGNDHNVMIENIGSDQYRVSGIIDFGDMIHTYTICELAIVIAYAILRKDNILETAINIIKGYHQSLPLTETELQVLFYLICARLCISVCLSSYRKNLDPDNEYLVVSEQPAWEALEKLMHIDPKLAHKQFRKACNMPPLTPKEGLPSSEILKIRERHLGKSLSISYQKPLKIVRGLRQYLYDENGDAYLDMVNNVCHVGHCHPKVVQAAQEQIATLNTNTRYLHDNLVNYAQQICAKLPDPLNVCFFVNSGSEANDLALRMAKAHTRNKDFIVVDHAYHGNLSTLIEISPYKFDGPGGPGAPSHVHKVPLPDTYRGIYKSDDPQASKKYASHVLETINNLKQQGKPAAAFIAESVPGVAGQIILPRNYLKEAYKHLRKSDILCIADEVQIGFGRVGTHFWGFETQGVVPDIVTMGKPIGNGHPLGAVITTQEIANSFNNGMEYFNTFGGNPVSCAIGQAVLQVIIEEKLRENSQKVGTILLNRLKELQPKHPIIGDVRGLGLFIGIELVLDHNTLEPAAKQASDIVEKMKERGILLSTDGPLHNVIKIKPPIVFNEANALFMADTLDQVLSKTPF
jgi:4-aminobutyrate aminotransferase-like enzyme/Ser/Thr protein kinase RdoA (MazF antagonist)